MDKDGWLRVLGILKDCGLNHVRFHSWRPPEAAKRNIDYLDVPGPVIGHETAEFQVTPDFREIPKDTGVLKARNLEILQRRLQDAKHAGSLTRFHARIRCLAGICQREDIEPALRTPGFGGFQLLDLQDSPGQGTALVGMLNVFMESKGIITPEERRQYCCETVPLLLMKKYTRTTATRNLQTKNNSQLKSAMLK